ncbi:MAG: FAD:protein FMN transferase, partial [Oribacterium sp.]
MKDSVKYLAPRRKRGAFFSLFLRFFLILSLLILLPGCGRSAPSLQRFQSQFMDVFDTVSVLTGYDRDEKSFQEKAEAVHKELRDCHALFDIYDDYEGVVNLKTVNERAGQGPVKVDGRIIELLKFGKEIYRLTGGKVNIAYGAVLSLWHEKREEGIADPE